MSRFLARTSRAGTWAVGPQFDVKRLFAGRLNRSLPDPKATTAGLEFRSAAVSRSTEVWYPFGEKHGRHRAVKRREFITLIGGAATAWPVAARGQQGERMRRIGVLMTLAADDSESQQRLTAFAQTLQELGWTDGRNIRIEYRYGAGDHARIRQHAAELAALAPDVIMTTGSVGLAPLLQATRTVPIVFTIVPDPVGAGFVDSLARPGGNATGFTQLEYGLSRWRRRCASNWFRSTCAMPAT
jgi:hypothetical protein